MFVQKEIVEEVENPGSQISLEEAKRLSAKNELGGIVNIQVAQVASRLTDRRIKLDVTDAAREWLANTGYDPAYGARPLRRLV